MHIRIIGQVYHIPCCIQGIANEKYRRKFIPQLFVFQVVVYFFFTEFVCINVKQTAGK